MRYSGRKRALLKLPRNQFAAVNVDLVLAKGGISLEALSFSFR